MKLKQIVVSIENAPGRLFNDKAIEVLHANRINLLDAEAFDILETDG